MEPGDTLEGRGLLLHHGRLIAGVDYHLSIPREIHFAINPAGSFGLDYETYLAGFILLAPADAAKIELTEYTLELANKSKKTIQVERRYKHVRHQGKETISFWVTVI